MRTENSRGNWRRSVWLLTAVLGVSCGGSPATLDVTKADGSIGPAATTSEVTSGPTTAVATSSTTGLGTASAAKSATESGTATALKSDATTTINVSTGTTSGLTAQISTQTTTMWGVVNDVCYRAFLCCSGLDRTDRAVAQVGGSCSPLQLADEATCGIWLGDVMGRGLCGGTSSGVLVTKTIVTTGTGVLTGNATSVATATGSSSATSVPVTRMTTVVATRTITDSAVFTGAPCDIYAADGGPCVAAHSTVRALSVKYNGPLYQVLRNDGATRDIGVLSPGGLADARAQDEFCADQGCTISTIYDQSGLGNHLTSAPPGGNKKSAGKLANAKILPIMVAGNSVYGEHNPAGVAYRNNAAVGTALGDNAETMYMIASGDYYNGGCCFEYGNVERNSNDNGEGAAEAAYFGSCTIWGKGAGDGPWVMGDLENGIWAGGVSPNNSNTPVAYKYVTALVKGDVAGANHWVIKVGDAQSGRLATPFDGKRPSERYNPMRKEGGITLGAAGDNSNGGQGDFFEGVMTAHFSSDAADDAVQANIVAAGYGR